ncbi:hypothetical protein GGF46_003103 [Coemansia sp. RSA 552]|nr:hypothetical protein GGF46_003103 [Coemansia sp. RSA 552]
MEPSDVVLLLLGVVCPPGSAALKRGLNREFIICVALTLAFWVPGIAYSWYLIFKYPLENFWRQGGSGQYHSIEEGLRRQSVHGIAIPDDDPASHSEEDVSRSTTMTSETASQQRPQSARSGRGRKPRRSRKSSAGTRKRSSSALQEAARNYALRQQQRQESNTVKRWFVDRFYFSDPTQVPPSLEAAPSELHELDASR